jgi:hypothetical protein
MSDKSVVACGGVPTGPAGVRENRGAGAACWTPWASITAARAGDMRVGAGLAPRQHWSDARVGVGKDLRPFVKSLASEPFGEKLAHPRVCRGVELMRHFVGGQPEPGK